jgi:hypothetical protein
MKMFFRFVIMYVLLMPVLKCAAVPEPDKKFKQAVSIKYLLPESLKNAVLKKVVADYNDNIYVLTDKGLYMVCENQLVKDLRYTPLEYNITLDNSIK